MQGKTGSRHLAEVGKLPHSALTESLKFKGETIDMTLQQLMNSVSALGFESNIENTRIFYEAASRALDVLYTDRAITKTVLITRLCPPVCKIIPEYLHTGADKSISYKMRGAAYSFCTVGEGSYAVFDGDKTRTESFRGTLEHRGIIESGEAIITFFGELMFEVSEIAVFGSLISHDPSLVPLYSELFIIDMKSRYPDFLSLSCEIKKPSGEVIPANEEDGLVYILSDYTGPIKASYRCKSPDISVMDSDTELKIPRECEALLPFLTASFIWLDDDAGKAQYYMAIYREMLSSLVLGRQGMGITQYVTNGWA